MSIFVLALINAAATALSPRVLFESYAAIHFRAFVARYIVSHVSFSEIVAMQISYVVLPTRRIQRIDISVTSS